MILLFAVILVIAIYHLVSATLYEKTEYYAQTKNPYFSVILDKGRNGEYRSFKNLNSLEGYKKFLFNIYLPKENGETTELDVVLLHESGMYVLESKNYSGWIFGTETQKNWTQTLPVGKGKSQKNYFLNPIIQNKGHIKWLRAYLQDEEVPIYSCIVFSDRCTLKDIHLTSGEHAVINRLDILNTVKRNIQKEGSRLTQERINTLYNKLYPLTQVDTEVKQEHIKSIEEKKVSNDNMVCPKCGGKLILRTASKGKNEGNQFYGCSNFPRCRYTKNIDE